MDWIGFIVFIAFALFLCAISALATLFLYYAIMDKGDDPFKYNPDGMSSLNDDLIK